MKMEKKTCGFFLQFFKYLIHLSRIKQVINCTGGITKGEKSRSNISNILSSTDSNHFYGFV